MQIYAKKDYKSIQFLPFLVEKLSQEVESIPEPRRGVAKENTRLLDSPEDRVRKLFGMTASRYGSNL